MAERSDPRCCTSGIAECVVQMARRRQGKVALLPTIRLAAGEVQGYRMRLYELCVGVHLVTVIIKFSLLLVGVTCDCLPSIWSLGTKLNC